MYDCVQIKCKREACKVFMNKYTITFMELHVNMMQTCKSLCNTVYYTVIL